MRIGFPDVVHAHDWHAGLVPVYLAQNPGLKTARRFHDSQPRFFAASSRSIAMLNGFAGTEADATGSSFTARSPFMKSGLVYSNRITTVSPTYAREICTPEFGCGLEGVLRDRGLRSVRYPEWRRLFCLESEDPGDCQALQCAGFGREARMQSAPQSGSVSRSRRRWAAVCRSQPPDFAKGMDLLLAAMPELLREGRNSWFSRFRRRRS